MKNTPFTIEQGIETQNNYLKQWKSILKIEKFELLRKHCEQKKTMN